MKHPSNARFHRFRFLSRPLQFSKCVIVVLSHLASPSLLQMGPAHAIMSLQVVHGRVSTLGRQSPPQSAAVREQASTNAFPEMLVSAIQKVMKEKGLSKQPSIRDFENMVSAFVTSFLLRFSASDWQSVCVC